MSKAFISKIIQQSTAVTDVKASRMTNDLIDAIVQQMNRTGTFRLSGFGTFTVSKTKAYEAPNPRTDRAVKMKSGGTVRFKASPLLKRAI